MDYSYCTRISINYIPHSRMSNSQKIISFRKESMKTFVYTNKGRAAKHDFTELCIENKFSVTRLAQKLNVSESSFRTAFHEYAGLSPKVWMRQARVLISLQLFREGKKIQEISSLLGYHDYSHMVKDYKACVGLNPNSMRDQLLSRQCENFEMAQAS